LSPQQELISRQKRLQKMENTNIWIIAALVVGGLAMAFATQNAGQKEGFWGTPGFKTVFDEPSGYAQRMIGTGPNYQPSVASRFSNVGYGAGILTQHRDNPNPFLSKEPMEQVNLKSGGATPLNGTPLVGSDGEIRNAYNYDRPIYANRRSRLRSQGDPLRGDLPIAPQKHAWFNPFPRPELDLREGSISVMGGVGNETSQTLAQMIRAKTHGLDNNWSLAAGNVQDIYSRTSNDGRDYETFSF
jgi:hypothetical protein